MGRNDEDPTTDRSAEVDSDTETDTDFDEPRVEATVDEQVHETGDEHFGLEGGVDIRPPSARENLRLT